MYGIEGITSLIIKYISLFTSFNFIVFSFILLFRRSPIKRANRILGITFILMTLFNLFSYYYYYAASIQSFNLLSIYIPIDLIILPLVGPLFLLYIKVILNQDRTLRSLKPWLHALPSIIAAFSVAVFMFIPTQKRVELLYLNFKSVLMPMHIFEISVCLLSICYILTCYVIIKRQLSISRTVTYRSQIIDIKWIETFLILDFVLVLVIIPFVFWLGNDQLNTFLALLLINIQLFYIFLKAILRSPLIHTETIAPIHQASPYEPENTLLFPSPKREQNKKKQQ